MNSVGITSRRGNHPHLVAGTSYRLRLASGPHAFVHGKDFGELLGVELEKHDADGFIVLHNGL